MPADYYYEKYAALLDSLLLLLRKDGLIDDAEETDLNSFVLYRRLVDCGIISPEGRIYLRFMYRLYPINYNGDVPFSRDALRRLLAMDARCLIKADRKDGRVSYPLVLSMTQDDIVLMNPGQGIHSFSDYQEGLGILIFFTSKSQDQHNYEAQENRIIGPGDFTYLVNKKNPLPVHYQVPDLICLDDIEDRHFSLSDPGMYLNAKAAKAACRMFARTEAEGYHFVISGAWRSHERQAALYREDSSGYTAKAGFSEHETGLAIDLRSRNRTENAVYYKYLSSICHQYGFIMRYPPGKVHFTGLPAERWHYRYVGEEAADCMYSNQWTLEEYHERQQFNKILLFPF